MNLLDYQQKIDMSLMNGNQFNPLGDNENLNRFKTWGMIIVPNIPNQKTVSPLLIWRENDNLIRNKVIWLKNVIKSIVHDCSPDFIALIWSITMDPDILKILFDNLT